MLPSASTICYDTQSKSVSDTSTKLQPQCRKSKPDVLKSHSKPLHAQPLDSQSSHDNTPTHPSSLLMIALRFALLPLSPALPLAHNSPLLSKRLHTHHIRKWPLVRDAPLSLHLVPPRRRESTRHALCRAMPGLLLLHRRSHRTRRRRRIWPDALRLLLARRGSLPALAGSKGPCGVGLVLVERRTIL